MAAAGAGLASLSPVLGWFGVAGSGSDSSGGVLGKMISPQNLTIACAAVGLTGREGALLRKVLPWSQGLPLVMCLIVVAQSAAVLGRMLP